MTTTTTTTRSEMWLKPHEGNLVFWRFEPQSRNIVCDPIMNWPMRWWYSDGPLAENEVGPMDVLKVLWKVLANVLFMDAYMLNICNTSRRVLWVAFGPNNYWLVRRQVELTLQEAKLTEQWSSQGSLQLFILWEFFSPYFWKSSQFSIEIKNGSHFHWLVSKQDSISNVYQENPNELLLITIFWYSEHD